MRFLVNENIAGTVVRELRARGHDVLAVKESMRGADDPVILARAQAESRVLITQDKDFGELAFRNGLPSSCGVILFRLTGDDPDADIGRMLAVIESSSNWTGKFAVVSNDRVRTRALPTGGPP